MPPEVECEHKVFVTIRWQKRTLAVPLIQLEGIAVDDDTRQALEDWSYWIGRGYQLS